MTQDDESIMMPSERCGSPGFGLFFATNFSLGPDVSFWGEAEVGRAAEFAASVENDPKSSFASRSLEGRDGWKADFG
jgi:hypothetical protein